MKAAFRVGKLFLCAATLALEILGATAAQAEIGGVPLWTNRFGVGSPLTYATAIALDKDGNLFVTGYSGGAFGTIKYSGGGVPVWTNLYYNPASDGGGPHGMAVDGSGNVFLTGSFAGSGGGDIGNLTIGYSSAGMLLWTSDFIGNNGYPTGIAVDANGNLFVMGGGPLASVVPSRSSIQTRACYCGAIFTRRKSAALSQWTVTVTCS